ncbi:hypothetical protein C8Q74DRAFT_1222816 [Fomes fomentarius]|nr:hypothetical protein C8Q74DRAFT_1222816 [Fomes fomentarius]
MTSLKRPASSDSTVSFGSSKKVAKSERHVVERFHEAQKQKQKEQNRVLDRVLKDRAADSKGKDKGKAKDAGRRQKGKSSGEDAPDGEEDEEGLDDAAGGTSREELEARMARAMMEAEDEEDEEDEEEEGGSAFAGLSGHDIEMGEEASDEEDEDGDEGEDEDEDGDEEMGSGDGEDEDDDDDDEEGDEDDEDDEDDEVINRQKQRYLPDHLFKSALASVPSRNSKIVFGDEAAPARSSSTHLHKRRRTKRPSKDIILGHTHYSGVVDLGPFALWPNPALRPRASYLQSE